MLIQNHIRNRSKNEVLERYTIFFGHVIKRQVSLTSYGRTAFTNICMKNQRKHETLFITLNYVMKTRNLLRSVKATLKFLREFSMLI